MNLNTNDLSDIFDNSFKIQGKIPISSNILRSKSPINNPLNYSPLKSKKYYNPYTHGNS